MEATFKARAPLADDRHGDKHRTEAYEAPKAENGP